MRGRGALRGEMTCYAKNSLLNPPSWYTVLLVRLVGGTAVEQGLHHLCLREFVFVVQYAFMCIPLSLKSTVALRVVLHKRIVIFT